MSLDWNRDLSYERIYLPADKYYESKNEHLIDEEIINYINREFPLLAQNNNQTLCYQVPKVFVRHGEKQGSMAEQISCDRLKNLKLPNLWSICFQGISYADRSFKKGRSGEIMTREHDLVVFSIYQGHHYVTLIEVKSICDDPTTGYKISDTMGVKNNKRSAQHQIRDHLEILRNICGVSDDQINTFIFWPFLSMWTKDPRGIKIKRWEKEDNHAFNNIFADQERFNDWFYTKIVGAKSVTNSMFNTVLKRFIVLSCGIFVNEIHEGMLALLSQEQIDLLYTKPLKDESPTIVHGAAGTGKTLLALHRIKILYEHGLIDENNRVLYICYWPGIRADFRKKLAVFNLEQYVDTERIFISQENFMHTNVKKYRHIFMDECEAICLAFNEKIVVETFLTIEKSRLTDFDENFHKKQCEYYGIHCDENDGKSYGDLWYLVDINQATLFIPKHSPNMLKKPTITLSKVMRNTGTIYMVFSQFYKNPVPKVEAAAKLSDLYLNNIHLGHTIAGPPVFWVDSDGSELTNNTFQGLIRVIIDLYSTKGIKPHDMCVLPFFVTRAYLPDNINKAISGHFITDGYRPVCTQRVEEFLMDGDPKNFLLPWALRVKGLEFKVVVIAIENEDFDCCDPEDRRKIYVMASRCTCLLVIVCKESMKDAIDTNKAIKAYPFGIHFNV